MPRSTDTASCTFCENKDRIKVLDFFPPSVVREKDACWEYCEKLEGNKVQCKFCHKVLNGGISRLKYHLSRIPAKGVHPCGMVRDDVTEKVNAILAMKDETKEASIAKKQRLAEARSLIATLPPANLPFTNSPIAIRPPLLPPQPAQLDAERCIAEFFFENNLDFTMTSSRSYQLMLKAVGGPEFKGPSRDDLKNVWLPKFKEEINAWIEEIKEDWCTTGCTILADTWTDNKTQALISFSISSPLGTFFHKSVDASDYIINKNTKFLYELFDSVIQDFGPENVVQIITDNVLNYGNVGKQIMQNYSTIFWSPCAAHCVNSILDEFSKIDWVNKCIIQAQCITKFIYNHEMILEMMKKFTDNQELVRTGITKPVSDFLTLQSMLKHRPRLKHMFTSPEYTTSPYAARPHSVTCVDTLDNTELWRSVEEIAAVSEPLLKILRDVSGGKPGISNIYESMTKAKDSIRTYYIMDEGKCKTFLDIIDVKWRDELHSYLHAAAAYLNPSIQYNQEVKFLGLVKEELHVVLDKVLHGPELMKDITSQIYTFRKSQGMFGSNLAKEARNFTSPCEYLSCFCWIIYISCSCVCPFSG
jgi:Protein of unknown function (DUF 659)/BED zinc finger